MVCACIDIGSNTTRLLVAETDGRTVREVLQQRVFTRLGGRDGIGPEKIERCCEAVAEQVGVARAAGAERLRVVGTAALRSAPNRAELVAAIEEAAGVPVDVLSGDAEAAFAFRGATQSLDAAPDGPLGVVDVGGGSSEIVVGTVAGGVSWAQSIDLGSALLADHHLRSDPPTPAELAAMRDEIDAALDGVEPPAPVAAYAVGGSATSLRLLVGAVLDEAALERGLALLTSSPRADVVARFGLDPERVYLLPAGMLLLGAAARALGGLPLTVGCGGLREGVLLAEPERAGFLP